MIKPKRNEIRHDCQHSCVCTNLLNCASSERRRVLPELIGGWRIRASGAPRFFDEAG